MAMNGKKGPEFPKVPDHTHVKCKGCGRDLGQTKYQASGFTSGRWMKVCGRPPCYAVTWYDIEPPEYRYPWQ